jgi:hypothetical protein
MSARQFGRDSGDTYGRHALVNPGGDNRQRDVLSIMYPERYELHPMIVTENYVGAHRTDDDGLDASGVFLREWSDR